MSALTWTVDLIGGLDEEYATHYADFGRGRYSVGNPGFSHTLVEARWHSSPYPSNQGENITGAATLEVAKAACESHAAASPNMPPK
jgi:hypothetical protein